MYRVFIVICAFLLAACGMPEPPNVSLSQLASYRLTSVEVEGEGVIRSWPAVEKTFLASGRGDPAMASRLDTEPASNFPALRGEIRQTLETRILAALKADGGALFTGQRPIVAHVTVLHFDVPSTGRRLLAGGNGVAEFKIDLVDPATHQVLASYPGQPALVFLSGGAIGVVAAAMSTDDVGDELIQKATALYVAWLKSRREASI